MASSPSSRGVRGRGGSGRGRGRGAPIAEATASGPFALGPSEQRGSVRSAPVRFSASGTPASLGTFGSLGAGSHLPRSHLGTVGVGFKEEDKEEYSDSDEPGLKRVDVSDVKGLDWMAPDTLRKVSEVKRTKGKASSIGPSGVPLLLGTFDRFLC